MKKLFLGLTIASLTTLGAFAMNYDQATSQNKPIVVMFHMHGCGACKQFSPILDKYESKFSNKFCFVKEDINDSRIAKTVPFETVPAIFIFEPKTNKAKRVSDDCAWDKNCFTKTLQEY